MTLDLESAFSKNINTLASMWYINIYCLERFRAIETDNDDNGFVMMSGKF
jgi:hypothetical protein